MNTRTARLLRLGILAARDPQRMQRIRLAHRIVRKAARREAVRIDWRREEQEWRKLWDLLEPTGDLVADVANRAIVAGITGCLPQRFVIGIDPATIDVEQAEHLGRFYA